jgi:hypothetical protein
LNIFSGCAVGSAGWADDPWGAAAGAAARAAEDLVVDLGRHLVHAGHDPAGVLALLEEAQHGFGAAHVHHLGVHADAVAEHRQAAVQEVVGAHQLADVARLGFGEAAGDRGDGLLHLRPSDHFDLALLVEPRAQHVVDAVPQEADVLVGVDLEGDDGDLLGGGVSLAGQHQGHQQHDDDPYRFHRAPGGSCLVFSV